MAPELFLLLDGRIRKQKGDLRFHRNRCRKKLCINNWIRRSRPPPCWRSARGISGRSGDGTTMQRRSRRTSPPCRREEGLSHRPFGARARPTRHAGRDLRALRGPLDFPPSSAAELEAEGAILGSVGSSPKEAPRKKCGPDPRVRLRDGDPPGEPSASLAAGRRRGEERVGAPSGAAATGEHLKPNGRSSVPSDRRRGRPCGKNWTRPPRPPP